MNYGLSGAVWTDSTHWKAGNTRFLSYCCKPKCCNVSIKEKSMIIIHLLRSFKRQLPCWHKFRWNYGREVLFGPRTIHAKIAMLPRIFLTRFVVSLWWTWGRTQVISLPWLPAISAKQSLCFLVKQGAENQAWGVEPVHNVWTMQGIFDQANNHCRVFTHM